MKLPHSYLGFDPGRNRSPAVRAESQSADPGGQAARHASATLSNVIELRDGRVLFADTKNKLFLRGDLKSGKVDTLGTRVDSLPPNGPPSNTGSPAGWPIWQGTP